ncbi:MAG: hypothetical protein AAGG81_07555 [Chlamydiota bacterium]
MRISIFGLSMWDKPASSVKDPPQNRESNNRINKISHRNLITRRKLKDCHRDEVVDRHGETTKKGSKQKCSVSNVHDELLKKGKGDAPKKDFPKKNVHDELVSKAKEKEFDREKPLNKMDKTKSKIHSSIKRFWNNPSKFNVHSEILKQTKTSQPVTKAQSRSEPPPLPPRPSEPPPLPPRPPESQSEEVVIPPPPPPLPPRSVSQNKEETSPLSVKPNVKRRVENPKMDNSLLDEITRGINLRPFKKEESDPGKVKKEEKTSKIHYGKMEENILSAINKGRINNESDQDGEYDDTEWDDEGDILFEALKEITDEDQVAKRGKNKFDDVEKGKVGNFSSSSPASLSVTPRKDQVDEVEEKEKEAHTRETLLSTLAGRRGAFDGSYDEPDPEGDWD